MGSNGDYKKFLAGKRVETRFPGIEPREPHPILFDFQRDLVKWALRRGRACLFEDCGLGKTFQQIEWARQIPGNVLILAPLAVAQQTILEAAKVDCVVRYCRHQSEVKKGITIANYEMLEHFEPRKFKGVVLDESSIIKHFEGKFRNAIISGFRETPFRLACTATPAPNDHMELGNHAEFVGAMSRTEMLSMFFVHDGGETSKWRLKGHAEEEFWKWVCSWAVMIRKPSDLGYEDNGFILPPLTVEQITVESTDSKEFLFPVEALTLQERIGARRDSIDSRVIAADALIRNSWLTTPNIIADTKSATRTKSGSAPENGIESTQIESGREVEPTASSIVSKNSPDKNSTTPVMEKSGAPTCANATNENVPTSSPITGSEELNAQTLSVTGILKRNTESRSRNTTRSLSSKKEDAQSADINRSDSTSITAINQTTSEDCSAQVATMDLEDSKTIPRDCVALQNTSREQWVVWCGLNSEQDALAKLLGDNCVSIFGSLSSEEKLTRYRKFQSGEAGVLITKVSMFGFGMNMQFCRNAIFLGLSDSWESWYQGVRRQWRFGQTKAVRVHIITSTAEGQVVANIKRKEADADRMASEMVKHMHSMNEQNIKGTGKTEDAYVEDVARGANWELHLGDCVEACKKIPSESVGFSIFSPPFASLYTYSASERDLGNVKNDAEFHKHFAFVIAELFRVLQPGRLVSFHCMDIPSMKSRDGMIGLKDFPAVLIQAFQAAGFIYHSRVVIWKDPLIEATRTKALGLMHKQILKDSAMCRQGLPDYLITMRKPGDNMKPIQHPDGFTKFIGLDEPKARHGKPVIMAGETRENREMQTSDDPVYSHQVWRRYASPVWMDIDQTRTLQRESARDEKDERHICPLQLDVIERAMELWSNPGDTVLSPFAGIGSEGFVAMLQRRKFIGIELKGSYWKQGAENLRLAEIESEDGLFAKIA